MCVFLGNDNDIFAPNFFQGLGENPCLLQPALKSNAPSFKAEIQYTLASATSEKYQMANKNLFSFLHIASRDCCLKKVTNETIPFFCFATLNKQLV